MKIRLFEIPEEGKAYSLNRQTAELNPLLQDLIGEEAYEIQFFLRPINSKDFELTGSVRTQSPQDCSRCGDAMKFSIQQKFREILIPKQYVDKNGKYSKSNHILSNKNTEDIDVIEVEDEVFDAGEYLHEVIALAIPFNPAPALDAKGACSLCHLKPKADQVVYDEVMEEVKKESPFAVLKSIKLN